MTITILGQGRWGTAVGRIAARNGHDIQFLHHGATSWHERQDAVFIALPVQFLRQSLQALPPPRCPLLSLSKGIELHSGALVSRILGECWEATDIATLSGPNLATEIDAGLPAATVVAAPHEATALFFQQLLHHAAFRVYTSTDLTGVELGGALKNVYAIAGGVCAGLQLGENAFASLLTRCVAELTRLGVRLGGRAETFGGLSGLGDLWLTANSPASRNHRVGCLLARGESLEHILAHSPGVAEGVATAEAVRHHPQLDGCERPIADEVYALLHERKPPQLALHDLLMRAAKQEA